MFNEKLSVYKPFFHFLYHVAHALEDSPIRESDNKSSWLLPFHALNMWAESNIWHDIKV